MDFALFMGKDKDNSFINQIYSAGFLGRTVENPLFVPQLGL